MSDLNVLLAMDLKISACTIPVSNIDRSIKFYKAILGCSVVADHLETWNGRTLRIVLMRPASGEAAFVLADYQPTMAPGSLRGFMLATPDIEAVHRQIAAAGIRISPIRQTSWARVAVMEDPDGNHVAIQQPNGP